MNTIILGRGHFFHISIIFYKISLRVVTCKRLETLSMTCVMFVCLFLIVFQGTVWFSSTYSKRSGDDYSEHFCNYALYCFFGAELFWQYLVLLVAFLFVIAVCIDQLRSDSPNVVASESSHHVTRAACPRAHTSLHTGNEGFF